MKKQKWKEGRKAPKGRDPAKHIRDGTVVHIRDDTVILIANKTIVRIRDDTAILAANNAIVCIRDDTAISTANKTLVRIREGTRYKKQGWNNTGMGEVCPIGKKRRIECMEEYRKENSVVPCTTSVFPAGLKRYYHSEAQRRYGETQREVG
jgi:hypothetical protein